MIFEPTEIPDVVLIRPKVHGDRRGFFMETWRSDLFAAHGIEASFVQDNHSRSDRGILRGMHFQVVKPQGKLVRVVAGEVFDAAVDLRRSSKSFGRWVGAVLSEENKASLWVPPGFAHGFLALTDRCEVLYKCTDFYSPPHERTLAWNDPDVGIAWPLPEGATPLVSDKDARGARLGAIEAYE